MVKAPGAPLTRIDDGNADVRTVSHIRASEMESMMKSNLNPSTPPDRVTFIGILRAGIHEVEQAAASVADAAAQLGEAEEHEGTVASGGLVAKGYQAMIRAVTNGHSN